jgi:hypothetical protein
MEEVEEELGKKTAEEEERLRKEMEVWKTWIWTACKESILEFYIWNHEYCRLKIGVAQCLEGIKNFEGLELLIPYQVCWKRYGSGCVEWGGRFQLVVIACVLVCPMMVMVFLISFHIDILHYLLFHCLAFNKVNNTPLNVCTSQCRYQVGVDGPFCFVTYFICNPCHII